MPLGVIPFGRDELGRIGLLAMAIGLVAYFTALPGAPASNFSSYLYAVVVRGRCMASARGLAPLESGVAMTAAIAVSVVNIARAYTVSRLQKTDYGPNAFATAGTKLWSAQI